MSVGTRPEVVARLASLVGEEHLVTAEADLALLSTDLGFEPHEVALAVVRPGTVEELAACVAAATAAGHPVVRAAAACPTRAASSRPGPGRCSSTRAGSTGSST
ncbi:MAG: hypothetical protein R3C15_01200 [Thermoleophilia bacterium]